MDRALHSRLLYSDFDRERIKIQAIVLWLWLLRIKIQAIVQSLW